MSRLSAVVAASCLLAGLVIGGCGNSRAGPQAGARTPGVPPARTAAPGGTVSATPAGSPTPSVSGQSAGTTPSGSSGTVSPAGGTASAGPGRLRYRYMTDTPDGRLTARYGYNLVDLGPYRSIIDALPAGQRALVWIGPYLDGSCTFSLSNAEVRQQLAGLANDPKVAGYYIADEADDALPAYGGRCPDVAAQVTARSRLVHQAAPGALTYEVVTEPGNFAAFGPATDILGADPYPCQQGRPCDQGMIPRYIAALRAANVAHYWGVLQAFAQAPWRYPTAGELQAMVSQWRQSDWEGEQTFAWSYAGQSLASRDSLLAVLSAVNHGT